MPAQSMKILQAIFKKYTSSTNSWSVAAELDDDIEASIVRVDANNVIYVFWTRRSPDDNIYCRMYAGGGLSNKLTAFRDSSHPATLDL